MKHEAADRAYSTHLGDKVLEAYRAVSQGFQSFGLLDYPSHWNIGDSAIWLGEIELLERLHGRRPDYVSHVRYAHAEPGRFLPKGLIYLHGGGNFGDIWPAYQVYREAMLQLYPDHRIVQLPQSIHFQKPEGIEKTKRAIGAHRDFHFMVRDHESLDFATRHFDCPVVLVPDSAFGIGMGKFPRAAAPSGIKCLFRSDKERREDAQAGVALFSDAKVEDWDRRSKQRQIAEKGVMGALMMMPPVPGKGALMALRERAFTAMARSRVALGFAQLDTAEVVVTDRLHGHIMASLLGKPHVVIDNFYGKIANFIKAWPADTITLQARDYAQAHDMAQQLLADQRARR